MAAEEIVVGSGDIYIADVGTAFPLPQATPAVAWTLLGASGDENYDEDGVVLTYDATKEQFIPAGATTAKKEWITEVAASLVANLVDLSVVTFAKIMNDATVSQVAATTGTPGYSEFDMPVSAVPAEFAVFFRGTGLSPEVIGMDLDILIYRASQAASQEIAFKKDVSMLKVEFTPLLDDSGNFVTVRAQTAAQL